MQAYIYNGTVITTYQQNSVIGTLTHRPVTDCSTPELLEKEMQHGQEALIQCKYPRWTFNRIQNRKQPKQSASIACDNTKSANKFK